MRISDVDWNSWVPEETDTLMFVIKDGKVLLIHKKRGLGAGKINGPGGHLEINETPKECAIRETIEELCITPLHVKAAGQLFFHAEDMPKIHAYVFTATDYTGTPTETDEAIPIWYEKQNIPYDAMWADDRYWLPQVLNNKVVEGWFTFVEETVLDHKVLILDV